MQGERRLRRLTVQGARARNALRGRRKPVGREPVGREPVGLVDVFPARRGASGLCGGRR
ncbi:hypothetical protein ABZW11_09370 [Nonomuraea sp. NPDC004580]|uniref:hypothetical protein n=1 Tax=Nonomuraea sp. NPDC004580 TaxID=3154552 RepID=UPI0033AD2B05